MKPNRANLAPAVDVALATIAATSAAILDDVLSHAGKHYLNSATRLRDDDLSRSSALLLSKLAEPTVKGSHIQKESMNFSELGLTGAQLNACESLGYKIPTAIQAKTIPTIL